jgi:hypothetical protein
VSPLYLPCGPKAQCRPVLYPLCSPAPHASSSMPRCLFLLTRAPLSHFRCLSCARCAPLFLAYLLASSSALACSTVVSVAVTFCLGKGASPLLEMKPTRPSTAMYSLQGGGEECEWCGEKKGAMHSLLGREGDRGGCCWTRADQWHHGVGKKSKGG